jgi:hypothetical protein
MSARMATIASSRPISRRIRDETPRVSSASGIKSSTRCCGDSEELRDAPVEDQVQIATVPSVAQVEQLQSTRPSSLQAVLGDAILKLRAAAFQSNDPSEIAYLSGIADRFQRIEENGEWTAPSGSQGLSSSVAPK